MNGVEPRVRFAPSPTGSLHLGNARTALYNWLVARQWQGTFILRIEDTDTAREEQGSEESIFEDLRWLGLLWDEGPGCGGPHEPYRQSDRREIYRDAAERLLERGRAYRCFCTEEQIAADRESQRAAGLTTRYTGTCRRVPRQESDRRAAAGVPHGIRFRSLPDTPSPADLVVAFHDRLRGTVEFPAIEMGDPVLLRRDGRPTYNFAAVVDDAAMGITLVLRGDDHLSNTPRQVLLYRALERPEPDFAHLPMVRGPDGERLSKRHGAESISEYRRQGYPPEGLLNGLALLGWSPGGDRTIVSLAEMTREFDLDRVNRSPATFDPVKLDWVSAQHIHRMPPDRLRQEVGEKLVEAGLIPSGALDQAGPWLGGVAEMIRTSIEHLDQVPMRCAGLFATGGRPASPGSAAALEGAEGRRVVEALTRHVSEMGEPLDADGWNVLKSRVSRETGLKGKALFHPIRVALTGEPSGPELDRLVPLIVQGSRLFAARIPALLDRLRRTGASLG